jgi:hypothetical protein
MLKRFLFAVLLAGACVASSPIASSQSPAHAPSNFLQRWQARATATQALQPKWIAPVFAPYPMLVQLYRFDGVRQTSSTLSTTWNIGSTKGLALIPLKRTEIDIYIPPFFEHDNKTADGFGDFSVAGKFRLLSANEKKGNYLMTASLNATVPTGSYKNGLSDATVTPALSGGKGFGKFDAFTTLGGTLPTGNQKVIGRTIASNTVLQYHAMKYLWPEFEINSTAFYGSTKDGKIQTFLTPGVMFGRLPLHREKPGRLGFVAGGGFQTAATHYHGYNHALIFTGRITF